MCQGLATSDGSLPREELHYTHVCSAQLPSRLITIVFQPIAPNVCTGAGFVEAAFVLCYRWDSPHNYDISNGVAP